MAAITLATVSGNGAVLVALTRVSRAPAHYALASLATADLLVGLFVLPLAAARELFVFHLNWAVCAFWSTLDVLCCTASILSLCALGWERYRAITAPLARAKRARQARVYAVLVWPVAAAVALPTVFIPSPKHHLPGESPKACDVNTNVGYVFFSTFFSFYLPGCIMVVLYARILTALAAPPQIRAHQGRSSAVTQGVADPPKTNVPKASPKLFLKNKIKKVTTILSPKGNHLHVPGASLAKQPSPGKNFAPSSVFLSRQRRATRTIVMLMALFLACWTPFFVMLPVDSLCECVSEVAWEWCSWLGYTNSALNPIVYAAAWPSVRQALRKSLKSDSKKTTVTQCVPGIKSLTSESTKTSELNCAPGLTQVSH